MANTNAETNINSEIGNGNTNISFVRDEQNDSDYYGQININSNQTNDSDYYGQINFNSNQTNDSEDRCSLFHGKSRAVIIVTVVIIVVAAVVVPVVIVFSSNAEISKEYAGQQTSTTTSSSVSGGSTAVPSDRPTSSSTSPNATSGSTPQTTGIIESGPWSTWGNWTECSVTCGSGVHKRYRSCNADLSTQCKGDNIQLDICYEKECTVSGKWTTWSSFGNCDVSCGGGLQTRTRTCTKANAIDLDCVGDVIQEKNCSNWRCPDCSMQCSVGILNPECDTCICKGRTVTGRVFDDNTGNPINSATFFFKSAPTRNVSISNSTGFFTLVDVCNSSGVLIKRSGFVDTEAIVNKDMMEIRMQQTVPPCLIETPQSKSRLVGENVTLCCEATSNPPVSYYEWFKDNIIINKEAYIDGRQLHLTNLSSEDSGIYQCRANSDSGAIKSTGATLTVKRNPNEFCHDALQSKSIELPFDCVQPDNSTTYEVGECLKKGCVFNSSENEKSCRENVISCCSIAESELETVQCTGYTIKVLVVKSCGCATCTSSSLTVIGSARSFSNGEPIKFGKVLVDGILKSVTDFEGNFELLLAGQNSRLTITIEDFTGKRHLPATKVFDIADVTNGILQVKIFLIKISDPVKFESNETKSLLVENNSSNGPAIEFVIPDNAFYNANGRKYNGVVHAHFTFVNAANLSNIEVLPGRFQVINQEGQAENLASLGVFNLFFEDTSGNSLQFASVLDAYINLNENHNKSVYADFKLWKLNPSTGLWDPLPTESTKRRKRRAPNLNTALWIGELGSFRRQDWNNIDAIKYYADNVCHFKLRLYKDQSLKEAIINPGRVIEIHQHYIDVQTNILQSFYHTSRNPESKCIPAVCDGQNTYISCFYHGRGSEETLYARTPRANDWPQNYDITDEERVLKVKGTLSSSLGPFFSDENKCYVSTDQENHLRFSFEHTLKDYKIIEFIGTYPDLLNPPPVALLAWYQPPEYGTCYAKIKIHFTSQIALSHGETLRLRVFSYGGSHVQVKDQLFGFYEEVLKSVSGIHIYCLQYKCSGTLSALRILMSNPVDLTRVKVDFMYPKSEMTCTIVQQAPRLIAYNFDVNGIYNTDHIGDTTGIFTFFAPTQGFDADVGLYFHSSSNDSLSQAYLAKNFCHLGKAYTSITPPSIEDIGNTVTFSCSQVDITYPEHYDSGK